MKRFTILPVFSFLGLILFAQATVEDYKRAFSLNEKFKDKVFYSGVNPQWIGKSNTFWYVSNTPEGRIYTLVDALKKTKKPLFDHQKLAEALTKLLIKIPMQQSSIYKILKQKIAIRFFSNTNKSNGRLHIKLLN